MGDKNGATAKDSGECRPLNYHSFGVRLKLFGPPNLTLFSVKSHTSATLTSPCRAKIVH